MKLADAKSTFDFFSGKASDVCRQLALAGVAIIWVLRVGDKTAGLTYGRDLLWPLAGFVLALACDMLQYVYASVAWGIFHLREERRLGPNSEEAFTAPRPLNYPTFFFYFAKLVFTIGSFILLFRHIAQELIR